MAPAAAELVQAQLCRVSDTQQNSSHICAALTASSVSGMLESMADAKAKGATCVEFRLDYLAEFRAETQLEPLINGRILPAIFTYRPKWEGGLYEGPENQRLEALRKAVELGADFVDVELQVAEQFLTDRPQTNSNLLPGSFMLAPETTKIIVSSHNYTDTPSSENLAALAARIKAVGADIIKIATTATDITDVARVLELTERKSIEGPIIALTMGPKGQIGRILGPKYGAFLTFGSLAAGKESAIGQPTVSDLANVYKIRRLGPKTKVFGLIGNPVSHSKGYLLHNALMAETGYDGVYVPYLVEDVKSFLATFNSPQYAGFSVTIPHKQTALECSDHVDPVVRSIGAINTLIRRPDGALEAHNTDWDAAISATEDGLREKEGIKNGGSSPLAGRLVVVVGAGGAGRALAFGAKQRGGYVAIANRSIDKAKELAAAVGGEVIPLADLARPEVIRAVAERLHGGPGFRAPVLTNTTSVGMQPKVDETPVPKEGLGIYSAVFDAVYTPMETKLLREAAALGATPVSGMEMFIRQAAKQFELFTGLPDPRDLASRIFLSGFKQ